MKGKKLTVKETLAKVEQDRIYRRKIFKELCTHVAQGLSLDCFSLLAVDTIKKYLKVYPEEFVQEELDQALRDGKIWWESCGRRQANGECLGNSRTWYYNMSNRYAWRDKVEVESEIKGNVSVNVVNYSSKKPSEGTERA